MIRNSALVMLAVLALCVGCGDKKSADTRQLNRPVPAGDVQNTPPEKDRNSAHTVLQGVWETSCVKGDGDGASYRTRISVDFNVLSYQELKYDGSTCSSSGEVEYQYFAVVKIEEINDLVMTHKVSYLRPDGTVRFEWVLRMENDSFLHSRIEFITTRSTEFYIDDYYRK